MKSPLNLLLMFVAILASASSVVAQDAASDGKLYVKINKYRDIEGVPVELADIKVTTSFGEVSIPLAKIDGVKMNATPDGSAVIAFKNGDLVSGKVVLDIIKVQTDWGQAGLLRLNNDRGIVGHIQNGNSLKLTTEFGEIVLPFERTIGFGFNADSEGRLVVLFSNGDLSSGRLNVEKIVFKTKFGDKEVPLTEIRPVTQSGRFEVIPPGDDPASRWSAQAVTRN